MTDVVRALAVVVVVSTGIVGRQPSGTCASRRSTVARRATGPPRPRHSSSEHYDTRRAAVAVSPRCTITVAPPIKDAGKPLSKVPLPSPVVSANCVAGTHRVETGLGKRSREAA